MNQSVSERVSQLRPSATLAVTAHAKKLRAEGKDVIGLGAGEPDFQTPEHIKQAAIEAIREGFTHYTAVDGTPVLKDAIVSKFERENGLSFTPDEIIVSNGAKQVFYNLCQAVLDPGDEVIIPAPYWVSYPDIVQLAEGRSVSVYAGIEQGFLITPEQLEAAITDKSRLLILNTPGNPTGAAYTPNQLKALGEALERHPQVQIVTDDIYEHIYWGDVPIQTFVAACPALADRTITVNGVSKAYAMTGWRIGYAAASTELVNAMRKIQGQCTSNPASISQRAAVEALNGDQTSVREMCAAFKQRHDYIIDALNALPGFRIAKCQGAFYAFPDVSGAIEAAGLEDDVAFCEHLLNKAEVALVPGTAFGAPGHLRLSYAADLETLETAIGRIANVLS